jgi:hypothetical protein
MHRREFLKTILWLPLGFAFSKQARADAPDLKSFGYYQGLGPNEPRSANRTDGTYHNMPTILRVDIDAAVAKTYNFWHGHGAQHQFTLTEKDFYELRNGNTIEVYTTVISGHRHAVRVVG